MAIRKLNNTERLALGIALIAAAGALFGFRRGYVTSGTAEPYDLDKDINPDDEQEIVSGLKNVLDTYGPKYAADIERLMRLETANFNSLQWHIGNTAGMEATSTSWPYGWNSLAEYADQANLNPEFFGTYPMKENQTGITKTFIAFPTAYDFIKFVAWFIQDKRGGNVGAWYSLNPGSAANYYAALKDIRPAIINSFTGV